MRRIILAIFLCLAPLLQAQAAEPLSAAEFEAYTTGKTLYYSRFGQQYGVEEHFEGRRVRWSFLDGECKEGVWYEDAGNICFVYDDNPTPQCWAFTRHAGGLTATFIDDAAEPSVYEATEGDEPMQCLGPRIGV